MSSLKTYRDKRDFRKTPEPRGNRRTTPGRQFVIQKHAASRLHYDFRLELDGALKSWAVPKGPSLDPRQRMLAVRVEDHPLEYGSFEGVIPEGEYGGGTVMLWDRGSWEPVGDDPAHDLEKGKLKFRVHGEKLKGTWTLVQMSGERSEQGKNWLLIKSKDEHARSGKSDDLLKEHAESVHSGRTMDQIATDSDSVWTSRGEVKKKSKAKAAKRSRRSRGSGTSESAASLSAEFTQVAGVVPAKTPPSRFKPQLATLTTSAPTGDDWIHELKLDGYRILARIQQKVRLITRGDKDWTKKFTRVAEAVAELGLENSLLDGEVVALSKSGATDFQALQNILRSGREQDLVYFVFDAPYLQGHDLTRVPQLERKRLLARVLSSSQQGIVRYCDHIVGQGEEVLRNACRHGVEGIICKRADRPYQQKRTRDWLKVKCGQRQEFVIGGWTDPGGSRKHFGALLLGYYEQGKLRYCGRVGTGFDAQTLRDVKAVMRGLSADDAPFADPPTGAEARGVHWLRPQLVAEVEYGNFTEDNRLRHPVFKGLRKDKKATEVTREMPKPVAEAEDQPSSAASPTGRRRPRKKPSGNGPRNAVAGVRLSNPDRLLYPEMGLTKLDLAKYYELIGEWVLPALVDRPLTLVRCPKGRQSKCFYQRHVNAGIEPPIRGIEVEEEDGRATYVTIRDLPGLISLVQLGVLEIHPWGCRNDRLDRPDQLILDLDPHDDVEWKDVIAAAHQVRELLKKRKLDCFARTTGGKGLHVVAPLQRRYTWDQVKSWGKEIADAMVRADRNGFTATASKAKRKGKIYVDYLRNSRSATAIANYSTRARPGAPVATPVAWDEVTPRLDPKKFDVHTVPKRLSG